MIVNVAVKEMLNCKFGDELVIANSEDYFNGNPQLTPVKDLIKENDRLLILI